MVDKDERKPAKRPRKYNSTYRKGKSRVPASRTNMSPLWQAVLDKIGGKEGVRDAALASNNPKAHLLAEMLMDSAFKGHGIDSLAKRAGLSRSDVVDIFRDRQLLLTAVSLYESLPEIVADAAVDAKASYNPCEECKGVQSTPPCYVCGGSGKVRKPGDKEKLRFIGEAANLVGKIAPMAQNNVQIINNSVQNKSFEDLMRSSSVNERQRRAIEGAKEAEVIDDSKLPST